MIALSSSAPRCSPAPSFSGPRTFVFFGGGTGGHLAPAFAVADAFADLLGGRCRVVFFTGGRRVERTFRAGRHFVFHELPFPRPGLNPLIFNLLLFKMVPSLVAYFKRGRVAACFGFGGYTSFPGVAAARLAGVPVFLFEQNAVAGKVNNLLAFFTEGVFSSFPEIKNFRLPAKVLYTGNPVRSEFVNAWNRRSTASTRNAVKVAVLGGSQGARALNNAMMDAIPELARQKLNVRFVHAAGPDYDDVSRAYQRFGLEADVAPFFPDICSRIADADLAISRAGGSMVAELMTLGVPALFIPYPFACDDHQRLNGEFFEKQGAALVCDQERFGPQTVVDTIRSLFDDRSAWKERADRARSAAKPDAARFSASVVLQKTCGYERGVL